MRSLDGSFDRYTILGVILKLQMLASLRYYLLENHWCLEMLKCLDIIKSSNWDYLIVKCLAIYF